MKHSYIIFLAVLAISIFNKVDAQKNDSAVKAPSADSSYYSKIFSSPEFEAYFPGAWGQYCQRNINLQAIVNNGAPNGIYTVIVSFMVDKEGNISEVKALNNPGYGTAEEAVRFIQKGPKWIPAKQHGIIVSSIKKQPINFKVSSH